MSQTFLLVHGAYHGGWCWRDVAAELRAHGHSVFTPTMTGLGERSHLLGKNVNLTMMIADLVGVIANEELNNVVIVGHSFGALPVLGVADLMPDRIQRVLLIDGLVVTPGHRASEMISAQSMAERLANARRHHQGLASSPPSAYSFGVGPLHVEWVERRLTPQPIAPYEEPVSFQNPLGNGLQVNYLRCTKPEFLPSQTSHPNARAAGFLFRDFAASHDCMITDPSGTVEHILTP